MKRLMILILASVFAVYAVDAAPVKRKSKSQQTSVRKQKRPPKRPGCISKDPYLSAMAVDANSGQTLFEDNADATVYPASTLKLMTLLVVQKQLEKRAVNLDDVCKVSARASKQGGSQVWLDPRETVKLEDLLYALMIRSANDAAVCIAEHVAGSVEAFVEMMNAEAAQLGMKSTLFQSPNGLPPTPADPRPQDKTTARDMSLLCLELCRHPAVFRYTSAARRMFREDGNKAQIDMITHNPFLKGATRIDGCNGLKTGYTATAGFSICVSVKNNGKHVIVLVFDSENRKTRDAKAAEIIRKAMAVR